MKNQITCNGFKASGLASGIKKNGAMDIGLILSETPASVAGVFTKNKIKAAPVIVDMEKIKKGICRAVIVNSGNANCCTGKKGIENATRMAALAANNLGIDESEVLVSSTGVIGLPMPMDIIEPAIADLAEKLHAKGMKDFARAIMTTDTVPKIIMEKGKIDGKEFTLVGIAKGAGMIRPDMATMLCYVCTDIKADHYLIQAMLKKAVDKSFNRITIDGDTSTNDTVLLLANGTSGVSLKNTDQISQFESALDKLLFKLARMLVKDGEGATKLVEIKVRGAKKKDDAKKIAHTVANSSLVKTAIFGEDANWGRIIAAAGRAGASLDPDLIKIYFDDVLMVKNGMGCGDQAEAESTKVLKKKEFTITIDLNLGKGSDRMLTCDFSIDYVKINADYRS